jgi:hypothetical protein
MNHQDILLLGAVLDKTLQENNMAQAKDIVSQLEPHYEARSQEFSVSNQLTIALSLAKYFRKRNQYDKSAHYSRQAIQQAKIGKLRLTRPLVDAYLNYAKLEKDYNQIDNARKLLATLLMQLEKNRVEDNYIFGLVYHLLAQIGFQDLAFDTAVEQFKEALTCFRKAIPEEHPIIYQTINELTETYIRMEHYQDALYLQEKTLQDYQKTDDKLTQALILLRMGEIYFYLDLKKARKAITQSLALLKALEQPVLLYQAKANLLLAELEENLANALRSINYYKRSLKQLEQVHEQEHFMVVYAYSKIGTLLMKVNQLEDAKYYLEKGLPLTKGHPHIQMQFLYALGKIYSKEQSYEQARNLYQAFLDQLEKANKKQSKAYADTLQAIGFNFIQQNDMEKAFICYQEAIDIYQGLRPVSKDSLGFASIRLAYCYEQKAEKDIAKASEWYQYGVEQIEKLKDKALSEEALAAVIDFYQRHDFPKQQSYYENKLVKLQVNSREVLS